MALSWNEIKSRAITFSKEWENTTSEEAEAKPFLEKFFEVFGISRKRVATFEHKVKKLNDADGYIDLLWKGTILIEMKSKDKSLDKAFNQAKEYVHGLKEHELPKYILLCDFYTFRLFNTEEQTTIEFTLNELVENVGHFSFIAGYQKKIYKEQDPVNIKAAELMGNFHDQLKAIGYDGHHLEVYLVRVLFCLFAEDTTIFDKQQFQDYIVQRTHEDGSDLAAKLQELFQVLDTPENKRFKNIDEQLNEFPYVNGRLFEEQLRTASFDAKMRQSLLDCCYVDWSKISPAIFGSMFQSVMNPKERRDLGAHYTSEKNILKLIKPLFLDELWKEFESIKNNLNKLPEFHKQLSTLKFLDPACGCGNFLVITYRELRLLELEILRAQHKKQRAINLESIVWLNVDQFYGIEYEEFPARIAEVAMWLIDHQMNMLFGNEFGEYFRRLPLKKAATIVHGNALQTDWQSLLNPVNSISVYADHANIILEEPKVSYGTVNVFTKTTTEKTIEQIKDETSNKVKFDFIIGNPPFSGSKVMSQTMRDDVVKVFDNSQGAGVLDYVAAWYIKAAKYIQNTKIKVAFVSTNSIVQGEQTSILWGQLLNKYNIKIHFAHRTFKWRNEAKGNAVVYCVIISFANYDMNNKVIYVYEDIAGEPHEVKVKNINPYLVDAKDILVTKKSNPISNTAPIMEKGNLALDYGHLIFTSEEKNEFEKLEPFSVKYFKRFLGGNSIVNGDIRYCLWLKDANPEELKNMKKIRERIDLVRKARLEANAIATNKLADTPYLFSSLNNPANFLAIPETSSELRKYIPMDFFDVEFIPNNTCYTIVNATKFHFGILTSLMHMAWVKNICGRMKSDFRYSNSIVYNNYPFPENVTGKQIKAIETASQKVLDIRATFINTPLATLYDRLNMPAILIKAHNELDKAVDVAYRSQPFTSEANRMEFLFELYEKYTADIFTKTKEKKAKK